LSGMLDSARDCRIGRREWDDKRGRRDDARRASRADIVDGVYACRQVEDCGEDGRIVIAGDWGLLYIRIVVSCRVEVGFFAHAVPKCGTPHILKIGSAPSRPVRHHRPTVVHVGLGSPKPKVR
jgi:hypothetical protein